MNAWRMRSQVKSEIPKWRLGVVRREEGSDDGGDDGGDEEGGRSGKDNDNGNGNGNGNSKGNGNGNGNGTGNESGNRKESNSNNNNNNNNNNGNGNKNNNNDSNKNKSKSKEKSPPPPTHTQPPPQPAIAGVPNPPSVPIPLVGEQPGLQPGQLITSAAPASFSSSSSSSSPSSSSSTPSSSFIALSIVAPSPTPTPILTPTTLGFITAPAGASFVPGQVNSGLYSMTTSQSQTSQLASTSTEETPSISDISLTQESNDQGAPGGTVAVAAGIAAGTMSGIILIAGLILYLCYWRPKQRRLESETRSMADTRPSSSSRFGTPVMFASQYLRPSHSRDGSRDSFNPRYSLKGWNVEATFAQPSSHLNSSSSSPYLHSTLSSPMADASMSNPVSISQPPPTASWRGHRHTPSGQLRLHPVSITPARTAALDVIKKSILTRQNASPSMDMPNSTSGPSLSLFPPPSPLLPPQLQSTFSFSSSYPDSTDSGTGSSESKSKSNFGSFEPPAAIGRVVTNPTLVNIPQSNGSTAAQKTTSPTLPMPKFNDDTWPLSTLFDTNARIGRPQSRPLSEKSWI